MKMLSKYNKCEQIVNEICRKHAIIEEAKYYEKRYLEGKDHPIWRLNAGEWRLTCHFDKKLVVLEDIEKLKRMPLNKKYVLKRKVKKERLRGLLGGFQNAIPKILTEYLFLFS